MLPHIVVLVLVPKNLVIVSVFRHSSKDSGYISSYGFKDSGYVSSHNSKDSDHASSRSSKTSVHISSYGPKEFGNVPRWISFGSKDTTQILSIADDHESSNSSTN